MTEQTIEQALIEKLGDLKYIYRPDIRDRTALEKNFCEKFDAATAGRKFNTILATSSINDAIAYHELFKQIQAQKQIADPKQENAVKSAIRLFSGESKERAQEIWLVEPAPVAIAKLEVAVQNLDKFM